AENPDIAWLSVYMRGTTAEVQLRETRHPEDYAKPADTYANVVAAEAGEIISVQVFEGEAMVVPGDVVLPGELLISGVVSMKKEGESRLEYAAGEVYAETVVPISVEVSRSQEKKVYTGREKVKKSIKIFKKTINLSGNTGIPYATYDTIDKMEEVCLFDRFRLPLVLYSVRYREYETVEKELSPDEAAEEAMRRLKEETERALGTGELLYRRVTTAADEEGTCRIESLLYILRDIAVTEEFHVRTSPGSTSSPENET
ncbi:MAG: sporulation protein YqfD, partial [Clostridia bacterium]|nr:sporulation protein YqfD [Clostridia bacterium]